MGVRGQWGDTCRHCGQHISEKWKEHRRKKKSMSLKAAFKKAKANCHKCGKLATLKEVPTPHIGSAMLCQACEKLERAP